ncbi:hypothetical protein UNDKW_3958 [Undibacterium sp. KW1]|uniref:hypothetical protein n=1 Tax=Undibacterium sp. KW1 TaxID=2058624 RepID=UPI001331E752|nr:hypothetical protein [Undibacterium sp. KW1]BBB62231.1 hypothetical protein UNDKW_3958 [Undibacterium sp. KW1]
MNEYTLDTRTSPNQHFPDEVPHHPRVSGQDTLHRDLADQAAIDDSFVDADLSMVMREHFERYIDLLLLDERNRLRTAIAKVKKDGLDDLRSHLTERQEFFRGTVKLGQLLGLVSSTEAKANNARFADELKILTERLAWYSQILTSPDSIDFRTKRQMRLKYAFSDMMS